jgi:hypothetical protein
MKVAWTKGLQRDLAVELTQNFKESLVVRKQLTKMLEERSAISVKSSCSKDGYENVNWAYRQADARGYERALLEVISLIT